VELEKTMMLDEILCRKKSRALWLKKGDRNTKCFHHTTKAHQMYKYIGRMAN
jgi:hypothetical protein